MNSTSKIRLVIKASVKIAHQAGYFLMNGRWHKLQIGKPAPKGAPVAHVPQAAGQHLPATLTTDQVEQLKYAPEKAAANKEMAAFNDKHLPELLGHAAAGDATAILGAGYGTNTHGKKKALIANYLLQQMGSKHTVQPGQKAGEHPAVNAPPTEEAHAEGCNWVMPLDAAIQEHKELVQAAETPSKADDKAELAEQKEELGRMEAAAGSPAPLAMPEFTGGTVGQSVIDYYEKQARAVMKLAASGDVAGLEKMKVDGLKPNSKGKISNTWAGKTPNSKLFLELHGQALASAGQAANQEPVKKESPEPAQVSEPSGVLAASPIKKEGAPAETAEAQPPASPARKSWIDAKKASLVGGKLWTSASGEDRYYFNDLPELMGLQTSSYKTGNISGATLNGVAISNSAAKKMLNTFAYAKVYWSPADGKFHAKGISEEALDSVVAAIKAKVSELPEAAPAPKPPRLVLPVKPPRPVAQVAAGPSPFLAQIPWDTFKVPSANSNASSHNPTVDKIKALAEAGDMAALQALHDKKSKSKQTYAVKQTKLAKLAILALQEQGSEPTAASAQVALDGSEIKPFSHKMYHGTSHVFDEYDLAHLGKTTDSGWHGAGMSMSPNKDFAYQYALFSSSKTGLPPRVIEKDVKFNKPLYTKAGYVEFSNAFEKATGKKMPSNSLDVTKELGALGYDGVVVYLENGNLSEVTVFPKSVVKNQSASNSLPPAPAPGPLLSKINFEASKIPASNTNSKSHNAAVDKIKAMANAGDVAGLQAFVDGKAGSKQTYAKKQHLLASTALAALQEQAQQSDPGPAEGDTKQGAEGMLVFKEGRWHKVEQDKRAKPQPSAAAPAPAVPVGKPKKAGKPKAAPAPQAAPGPAAPVLESIDTWTQTGPQGGSNPGGRFKDQNGVEWYCKFPADADVARSEVLAASLYGALGIAAQNAKLITKDGKVGIASLWVDVSKAPASTLAQADGVKMGFAADAWLGNWDVVGAGYDNLQIGPSGKAVRVDAGGSLEYRAQGGKKAFGAVVSELDSLRDPKINPQAAAVFGGMTDADIAASVAKVLKLPDATITSLVMQNGPGDEAHRKALAATLLARKADLAAKFPKAGKGPLKALDPSALPVDASKLPKRHDFENWNGPGKGLSSKAHVNQANATVEQQMVDLAKQGNLAALQAFHFQPLSKETGAPLGDPVPIEQHPSKHVVQLHDDLVQALDEIANPPQPLKIFRETDVSTLDGLAAAFPPKPFGTTAAKVASNEKLGFWVALGAVKRASKVFAPAPLSFAHDAIQAAYGKFKKASSLAQHFVKSVQASGSYNDLFRDGKEQDHSGNKLSDVAKAALEFSTEQPEGTTVYRWQNMSDEMVSKILASQDGTVFQATGPMCTSYEPKATSHFGKHRVVFRYAKGAKAVESFGSGGFASEKEVTTLPNSRFVILSKQMVPDVEHGNPSKQRLELEVLMLPPDLGIK